MAFWPSYSVFIGLFYQFKELIVQTCPKLRLSCILAKRFY